MRLSNRYTDDQSWQFHIEDKELIRKVLQSPDCKATDLLKALITKEEWMRNDGEGEPPNYQFILKLKTAYLEYKKTIKVPIKDKLWIDKMVDWIVALFYQDSAYVERMGGAICFFIFNRKLWEDKTKEERTQLLFSFHQWWDKNDKRDRTRWMIDSMIKCVIKRYMKQAFWMKSINFCIDYVLEHSDEFEPQPLYEPKNWYPAGRGYVQNEIFGGMA